jgi:hypothetical protein
MGQAQAGIIYTPIPNGKVPNGKVGFSSGSVRTFFTSNAAFGGVGFLAQRSNFFLGARSFSYGTLNLVKFSGHHAGTEFAKSGSMLRLFSAGSMLGASAVGREATVAFRSWSFLYSTGHNASPLSFTDEYALFKFSFGGQPYYGWVELSLTNLNVGGSGNGNGPDVTVSGWAFEDQPGVPIPAGDEGSEAPEPGTLGTTGLAALALGAVGVRRWRVARRGHTA